MFLRTTVWMIAGAAIFSLATRRSRLPRELAVMMMFPSLFFSLAMLTNLNIGDRYVLPMLGTPWRPGKLFHRQTAPHMVAAH